MISLLRALMIMLIQVEGVAVAYKKMAQILPKWN
jgi:hypothetical protein